MEQRSPALPAKCQPGELNNQENSASSWAVICQRISTVSRRLPYECISMISCFNHGSSDATAVWGERGLKSGDMFAIDVFVSPRHV